MTQFRNGLVVGKFYPPHAGHHHLIRTAAAQCDRVTVVAAASQVESIALSDRLSWMREEHAGEPNVVFVGMLDDAPIDYQSARAWAAHNAIFDAALRRVGGGPVDAVFSGEDYGDELARHHGAVHVRVGQERLASGTGCRADVAASWDLLAPATRAGLAGRLAVLGAESTGTTAVSRALAEHFRARGGVWTRTQWVAEYGRERSEEKLAELRAADSSADLGQVTWGGGDFLEIAAVQTQREEAAARAGSPLLVCDTDAFATTVWERRYLGEASRHSAAAQVPHHDVYLVTDHVGVPFVQDGLRDGEHIREEMTEWFLDALTLSGRSWVLLTGSLDERVEQAVAVADQTLRRRMTFADPLAPPVRVSDRLHEPLMQVEADQAAGRTISGDELRRQFGLEP